jgi:hypothetical protein
MTEFAQIFRVALPGGRVCLLCTNNGKRRLPTSGLVLLGMFDPKQGGLFFPKKGGRGGIPHRGIPSHLLLHISPTRYY